MIGTLGTDYVDAARSRGVSEFRLVRKHAYRPALIPIITVIGLQIALLLSGAVLTETTFEWKGLGFQLVQYIKARDFVAVQGIVVAARGHRRGHQLHRRHHRRADRPAGEVLMMHRGPAAARRRFSWRRLPVVHQLRQSVGLQRGMLIIGLVLTAVFIAGRRSSRRCSRPTGSPSCAIAPGPFGVAAAARARASVGHHGRRLRRACPG